MLRNITFFDIDVFDVSYSLQPMACTPALSVTIAYLKMIVSSGGARGHPDRGSSFPDRGLR